MSRLYGSLRKCGGVAKPQDLKIPWSGRLSPLKLEVLEAQYFSHSAAFAFDCIFVSPYVPEMRRPRIRLLTVYSSIPGFVPSSFRVSCPPAIVRLSKKKSAFFWLCLPRRSAPVATNTPIWGYVPSFSLSTCAADDGRDPDCTSLPWSDLNTWCDIKPSAVARFRL